MACAEHRYILKVVKGEVNAVEEHFRESPSTLTNARDATSKTPLRMLTPA
jgi:hypothetical protein